GRGTGGDEAHHAETAVVDPVPGAALLAVRGPASAPAPTAAAQHVVAADGFGPAGVCHRLGGVGALAVEAPLVDVAVHVIEPPGVRRVRADADRLAGPGPFLRRAAGVVGVDVRLPRRQGIAVVERGGRAGTAGVFPLGLGGPPVDPAPLP